MRLRMFSVMAFVASILASKQVDAIHVVGLNNDDEDVEDTVQLLAQTKSLAEAEMGGLLQAEAAKKMRDWKNEGKKLEVAGA